MGRAPDHFAVPRFRDFVSRLFEEGMSESRRRSLASALLLAIAAIAAAIAGHAGLAVLTGVSSGLSVLFALVKCDT